MTLKYKKMIDGMSPQVVKDWSVYLLRCGDGSLYTGVAKNVEARLRQHQNGRGAAYTRTHLPVKLEYQENGLDRKEALQREFAIKRLSKFQKESLIRKP